MEDNSRFNHFTIRSYSNESNIDFENSFGKLLSALSHHYNAILRYIV